LDRTDQTIPPEENAGEMPPQRLVPDGMFQADLTARIPRIDAESS
jgi:hypothetical protein